MRRLVQKVPGGEQRVLGENASWQRIVIGPSGLPGIFSLLSMILDTAKVARSNPAEIKDLCGEMKHLANMVDVVADIVIKGRNRVDKYPSEEWKGTRWTVVAAARYYARHTQGAETRGFPQLQECLRDRSRVAQYSKASEAICEDLDYDDWFTSRGGSSSHSTAKPNPRNLSISLHIGQDDNNEDVSCISNKRPLQAE
ncbi:hypothetical protein BD309DRAFT_333913 [Dichomitus squalens]|nr:hypothetical protein BD309DRAFT_333913 [Dichomitus squalens]